MSSKAAGSKGNGKGEVKVRKIEQLEQRTKNMKFRIDMPVNKQNLYLGMAIAGSLTYLVGLGLYIYQMFSLKLGDLRYAVIVVGVGLAIFLIRGYAEVFREKAAKSEILTADEVTSGCDRVTNISMASGQIFLAVVLMELLSRSEMPRWVPAIAALGAILAYCGAKSISEAVKEVGGAGRRNSGRKRPKPGQPANK